MLAALSTLHALLHENLAYDEFPGLQATVWFPCAIQRQNFGRPDVVGRLTTLDQLVVITTGALNKWRAGSGCVEPARHEQVVEIESTAPF